MLSVSLGLENGECKYCFFGIGIQSGSLSPGKLGCETLRLNLHTCVQTQRGNVRMQKRPPWGVRNKNSCSVLLGGFFSKTLLPLSLTLLPPLTLSVLKLLMLFTLKQ